MTWVYLREIAVPRTFSSTQLSATQCNPTHTQRSGERVINQGDNGDFLFVILTMPYQWIYRSTLPYLLAGAVDLAPLGILFLSLGFGFQSYLRMRGGWLLALLLVLFTFILIILVGLIVSTVIFDNLDNQYWNYLTDWSQPFSLLRDLASWALRISQG